MRNKLSIVAMPLAVTAVLVTFTLACSPRAHAAPPKQADKKLKVEVVLTGKQVKNPFGVGFDAAGHMYIAEYEGGRLHKLSAGGKFTTIAGAMKKGFAGDGGPAKDALFNGPHNVSVTPSGDLYISDTRNNLIRKIAGAKSQADGAKPGTVTTIAGIPGKKGFSGDGGPANKALLADPISISLGQAPGVALEKSKPVRDHLYIADIHSRRIRVINLNTNVISTLAGTGKRAAPKDGSLAAKSPLSDPRAVDIDSRGNVYVLERGGHALRVIDTKGRIRTVAGTGKKGSADGPGLKASLNGPKHICIAGDDSVIIADAENHLIRRYDPTTRTVSTLLGTRRKGGKPAGDSLQHLARPHGVWVQDGVLWVCDSYNDRVLRVTGWE